MSLFARRNFKKTSTRKVALIEEDEEGEDSLNALSLGGDNRAPTPPSSSSAGATKSSASFLSSASSSSVSIDVLSTSSTLRTGLSSPISTSASLTASLIKEKASIQAAKSHAASALAARSSASSEASSFSSLSSTRKSFGSLSYSDAFKVSDDDDSDMDHDGKNDADGGGARLQRGSSSGYRAPGVHTRRPLMSSSSTSSSSSSSCLLLQSGGGAGEGMKEESSSRNQKGHLSSGNGPSTTGGSGRKGLSFSGLDDIDEDEEAEFFKVKKSKASKRMQKERERELKTDNLDRFERGESTTSDRSRTQGRSPGGGGGKSDSPDAKNKVVVQSTGLRLLVKQTHSQTTASAILDSDDHNHASGGPVSSEYRSHRGRGDGSDRRSSSSSSSSSSRSERKFLSSPSDVSHSPGGGTSSSGSCRRRGEGDIEDSNRKSSGRGVCTPDSIAILAAVSRRGRKEGGGKGGGGDSDEEKILSLADLEEVERQRQLQKSLSALSSSDTERQVHQGDKSSASSSSKGSHDTRGSGGEREGRRHSSRDDVRTSGEGRHADEDDLHQDTEDDVASIARLARAQRQRARMIEKGDLIPADSACALTGEWGSAVRLKKRQTQNIEPLRSWADRGSRGSAGDVDIDERIDDDDEDGEEEEEQRKRAAGRRAGEENEDEDDDDDDDPAARLKEQLHKLKAQQRQELAGQAAIAGSEFGGEGFGRGVGGSGAGSGGMSHKDEEEEAWEAWEREKILKGAGRKHLLRQQQLMEQRQQEQQVYLQQKLLLQRQTSGHHSAPGTLDEDLMQKQLQLLQQQQLHQKRMIHQLANPNFSMSTSVTQSSSSSISLTLGGGGGGQSSSSSISVYSTLSPLDSHRLQGTMPGTSPMDGNHPTGAGLYSSGDGLGSNVFVSGAAGDEASLYTEKPLVEAQNSQAWMKEVWGVDTPEGQAKVAMEWLRQQKEQLFYFKEEEEQEKDEQMKRKALAADRLRLLEAKQLSVEKKLNDLQDFLILVEDFSGFLAAKEKAVDLAQSTLEDMERQYCSKKFERRVLEFDDMRRIAFFSKGRKHKKKQRARENGPRASPPSDDVGDQEQSRNEEDSSSDEDEDYTEVDEFGRSKKYTQKLQRSERDKARRYRRSLRRKKVSSSSFSCVSAAYPSSCSPSKVLKQVREATGNLRREERQKADSFPLSCGHQDREEDHFLAKSESRLHELLGQTLGEGWETSEDEEDDGGSRLRKDRVQFSSAALEVMADVQDDFVSITRILDEIFKIRRWFPKEFDTLKLLQQVPDLIQMQIRWQLLWWNPLHIAPAAPITPSTSPPPIEEQGGGGEQGGRGELGEEEQQLGKGAAGGKRQSLAGGSKKSDGGGGSTSSSSSTGVGLKEEEEKKWICDASLENFDWFLQLALFVDRVEELNNQRASSNHSSLTSSTTSGGRDTPDKEKKNTTVKKKSSSMVEELQPTDSAPYDPTLVMSELIKKCVIPRVSAALRCTDSTSYTSVQYASQLLGELLLFKDENSLPHITKVLQDFVAHILTQISALLPVEYVKQVAADPPQFRVPRTRSTSKDSQGTASPNSVSTSLGAEGGLTRSQEEKDPVHDENDDDDAMITKRESVELYVHRALKMTACCTSLVDILSDPLLIHICMQEIFVDRLKPLLQAVFPPSQQLVLFGIFIYLLPLRWLIQLQQEKPSSSSSTVSREKGGGSGVASQPSQSGGGSNSNNKGHMQQLLSALVELGEALVDEDERGELLLLLQKISPQDEIPKIQGVFEQRRQNGRK
ncbi:hypothetical protein CSUI_005731 [Cystoisospora suis]|uniref:Uncharacterized protein n=1 Tax=Cystoisospora suis TaxID=483139 RepID=A0A2C6KW27_9APIC|nr:hypothetical protein CSUI_005731 [Cystoisospora suis]